MSSFTNFSVDVFHSISYIEDLLANTNVLSKRTILVNGLYTFFLKYPQKKKTKVIKSGERCGNSAPKLIILLEP